MADRRISGRQGGKVYSGRCEIGKCGWDARLNGDLLIMPEDFNCKNCFINPQYQLYVCCRERRFAEGEGSFCEIFREVKRQEAEDSGISRGRYRDIIKELCRREGIVFESRRSG